MGKPEIMGYQTDPANWSAPPMPAIAIDSDGAWMESLSGMRTPIEDVDAFYRYHGWKRVYKPREFRASPRDSGYEIKCNTCGTVSWAIGYRQLPHDWAVTHARSAHSAA
jgi:hypothetical protein